LLFRSLPLHDALPISFILFIACINFMNLSTARSSDRAKEVGIRKVMGSLRSHLVRQFLVESLVLSLTAFLLAVGLAQLFLPVFNALSLKDISLPFDDWRLYVALVIGALVVGVLAGLYPSLRSEERRVGKGGGWGVWW